MTRLVPAGLVAVLLFATIGQLSHDGGVSVGGYAADTLPFLGCWLAAAYRTRRFVPTWLCAAVGGVAIRTVVLSHYRWDELSFFVVTLLFLGVAGFAVWLLAGRLQA